MRRALSLVLLASCSSPEPAHFLWSKDAQSLENPFPDARLMTEHGTALRVDFYTPFIMRHALTKNLKAFFDAYIPDAKDHLVGLGNFSPTLLLSSSPVDPATLEGHFARLRKTAAGYEVLERSLVSEHSTVTLQDTGRDVPTDGSFPEFTLVRASVPLPEGEEGLLVVLKGVKTTSSETLGRGTEWHFNHGLDLEKAAKALGVPSSDIVLALPLKAGPIRAEYDTLKAWVDSPAGLAAITIPPKGNVDRPVGVWKSSEADWNTMLRWLEKSAWGKPTTHVGAVVLGEIAARDPRENGAWKKEWVAAPSTAPVVPLPFVISVPSGTKPAGGWPIVIGAHGLGGRNVPVNGDGDSFCLEFAEYLATAGIACVGIDAPSHGTRGNIFEFFEVEHALIMRENFREMTFDLMQIARAMQVIDVDGDTVPDFEPKLGYFGNSLGSIMGSSYVALDDRISYAALNVPGGGLSNILVSTDIRDRLGLLLVAKTSITFGTAEYYSAFPIFRAMAQPFLESGDPINVLGFMPHDRALFIQMGVGDITIPNFTSRGLEAVAGLDEPTASVSGAAPLRAFYAVDPAKFLPASQLPGYNGHNVIGDIPFARTQLLEFLKSKGTKFVLPP